jgi:tRNA(Leu) C34 or U34 (ribose-2'-O)-methylase TrmL
MFELLILILVGVIGYHIGIAVVSYQLRYLIHKEARRLGLDKSNDINAIELADHKLFQLVIEKTNDTIYEADYTKPVAIILGSEENGISGEYMKRADSIVKIPMSGRIESLNVSAAAGMILSEAIRQRSLG